MMSLRRAFIGLFLSRALRTTAQATAQSLARYLSVEGGYSGLSDELNGNLEHRKRNDYNIFTIGLRMNGRLRLGT
jgi:hypothetical protein